jgi:SAM-dependent methyltransferase
MNALRSAMLQKIRRVRHSAASSGLRRTLADIFIKIVINSIGYNAERDPSFDSRYGTDTTGRIQTGDLGVADASVLETARLYLPSPPRVTRWMLQNVGIDHSDFTFVDLGCGKGRVLLVASEFAFRAIHGVDISAELCNTARINATVYRPASRKCRDIHVHNLDATKFEFPGGHLLIHLYHSFDVELTVEILRRIGDSPRSMRQLVVAYLVYSSDVRSVKRAFAKVPWMKLRRYEHSVTGEYDWLFFSN